MAVSSANGRASWPNQLTAGTAAKLSPAASPAAGPTSRRPSAVIRPAAAAMASAEGSRRANSPLPASRTSGQMSA